MSNVRWEGTPNLKSARIDHYEAEGHVFLLSIDFNPHAYDDAGAWDVEIGAIMPATRIDTEYDITIDSNMFFDLDAAKLWAESVDLHAFAEYLASEAQLSEYAALEAYEKGAD